MDFAPTRPIGSADTGFFCVIRSGKRTELLFRGRIVFTAGAMPVIAREAKQKVQAEVVSC
jgi:hypothetical protein